MLGDDKSLSERLIGGYRRKADLMNFIEFWEAFVDYARWRWKGDDHYHPLNLHGWIRTIHTEVPAKTLTGFRINLPIRIMVEMADHEAWAKARMLEPDNQKDFAVRFYEEVVKPTLLKDAFFAFRWVGDGIEWYPEPWLWMYRLAREGDTESVVDFDWNLIEQRLREVQWTRNGCKVSACYSYIWHKPAKHFIDEKLQLENYSMLTANDLKSVEHDAMAIMAVERAIVSALRRIKTVEEARADEVRMLAEQLRSKPEQTPDPLWEKMRHEQAYQGARLRMIEIAKQQRQTLIEETKRSSVYQSLPPEKQKEWLERIEDDFDMREAGLWGNGSARKPSKIVKDVEAFMEVQQSLAESKQSMHDKVEKSNLSADEKSKRHREIDAYYSQLASKLREVE
jgi:hypothetical protein